MNKYLPLEKAINLYLQLDVNYEDKLAPLIGKVVRVDVSPMTFFLLCEKTSIQVLDTYGEQPDTTLKGHPLAFIKLNLLPGESFSLFKKDMSISGDVSCGQQLQELFAKLDIDWEEHLSKITGDIIAYQLTSLAKDTKNTINKCVSHAQKNLTEFLQEETRILPPREELNDFFGDIDLLRLRVDRLEAKIKELLR